MFPLLVVCWQTALCGADQEAQKANLFGDENREKLGVEHLRNTTSELDKGRSVLL